MPKKLRCWLLCEDIEQERLFRPILERHFRRVYVEPRKARGGASFVLQRVGQLVSYIRQHQQEAVGLLVVIDGDATGLAGRLKELADAANLTGATWEQKIAKCIPCRSIETWELWLCGARSLDEQTSYKTEFRAKVEEGAMGARKAAEAWLDVPPDREAEERSLPALVHGRKEIARLRELAEP